MKYYHACPITLDEGSVILPGNWGRLEKTKIGAGDPIIFREFVLESIRKQEFKDKPSRMEATFSCPDIKSTIMYMQAHCPESLCYEVEIVNPGSPSHIAPCNLVGPFAHQNTWEWAMDGAKQYWAWDPSRTLSPMEVVSSSALRIVGRGKKLTEIINATQPPI